MQEVWDAAVAVTAPQTESSVRAAASQYLQQYMTTPQSWSGLLQLLQCSLDPNHGANETSVAVQLLCLQLLQTKIRTELQYPSLIGPSSAPPNNNEDAVACLNGLTALLEQHSSSHLHASVVSSVCTCVAALAVRTGQMGEWTHRVCSSVGSAVGQGNPQAVASAQQDTLLLVSLKILTHIPLEVQSCASLTTAQVTEELSPHLDAVLLALATSLKQQLTLRVGALQHSSGHNNRQDPSGVQFHSLEALKSWTEVCHVTLSTLGRQRPGVTESLLSLLVQTLTLSHDEQLLVVASETLTEAILVPTDSCTETRNQAMHFLLVSASFSTASPHVSHPHFLTVPLDYAMSHELDNACHALATLATTMVVEHVDELVQADASALSVVQLLLQLQEHPQYKVRMLVLEVWLTVQEVPTSERHESWKAPLFSHALSTLLRCNAYPSEFCDDWEDCEVDESEWMEFRQMLKDVWISLYFLLRSSGVETLVRNAADTSHWRIQESALSALSAISRDVCSRLTKTNNLFQRDQDQTGQLLLQLLNTLLSLHGGDPEASAEGTASNHLMLLKAMVEWIGATAKAWDRLLSGHEVIHLLAFCRSSMVLFRHDASKDVPCSSAEAIRSLLSNCSSSLIMWNTNANGTGGEDLIALTSQLLEAALDTGNENAVGLCAEGCSRLLVQDHDAFFVHNGLSKLVQPVVSRGNAALSSIQSAVGVSAVDGSAIIQEHGLRVVQSLGRCLHALKVVVRFCDNYDGSAPVVELINVIWRFMENVSSDPATIHESIFVRLTAIHEQLLRTVPNVVAPNFQLTLKFVVDVFDRWAYPSAIAYMSKSVEIYGPSNRDSFGELLNHVSASVFAKVSGAEPVNESAQLIKAFYEMNQRYILFCPSGLVGSSQFSGIVSFAVEFVGACQERESTRATLIFLSQLFGWRSLRLAPESQAQLQPVSGALDEMLLEHGPKICRSCMETLIGGSQMLWPPCTDCLFAVLSTSSKWPVPEDPALSVAKVWLEASRPEKADPQLFQQVAIIFLRLCGDGPRGKPKARMLLTDFCKIHAGEMSVESLITYSLP